MIRRFVQKIFTRRTAPAIKRDPVIIPVKTHGITRDMLSRGAERVCDDLERAGYQAFVVGGAVRDLLLGRDPKDFDIATNATPEQVRRCCRRSRIIGRRFQIVHVMVGQELIEVTTFRALHDDDTATDEHGRVLRDNTFGSQSDDAARRDFTVNALYYDPYDETIHDYHHGYADLKAGKLCMIGDPEVRYREDPVRMLRAVRLGAKLGLDIDTATRKPIRAMAPLLDHVPPARLFDEMLKLLTCGDALACLKRLRERNDLPFVGLIGSKTKWASFSHRLLERGFTQDEIDRITCPIGLPGIKGKEPEVIAASVAAQLLQTLG